MSIFEYDEEQHIQQERDEAMAEGIEKGTWVKLADLTRKQINRGLDSKEIADIFGEDFSEVEKICELIKENPSTDTEQLYELYFGKQL